MITLRRNERRRHLRRRKHESWLAFFAEDGVEAPAAGFGALELLDEERIAPAAAVTLQPQLDSEVISYVLAGTLAYEDSNGGSGVLHAGEFQRITCGQSVHHDQRNASRTEWAHVFRIWIRCSEALLPASSEQRRFYVADRRGGLCAVASPDGRRGSLLIHQNAVLYSAMLDSGQHLVHELASGRSAWLHVVRGEAKLDDVVLSAGDGAGITAQRAVSLTVLEETEILLVDLSDPGPPPATA
jgi:redox-sensitive bicupin YhaK (pirin superfamily)